MDAAFRPDDEALLARIEDELVFRAVWRRQVEGVAAPGPARGAGMIAMLRARPGGTAIVARAAAGDVGPVLAALAPDRLAGEAPAMLHHLAIHFGRVSDGLEGSDPAAADEARLRSIAAWLALSEERRYLEGFARRVAGASLPAAEADVAGRAAALEPLEHLGQLAREGARERTAEAGRALATLARVHRAAHIAGLEGNPAIGVQRRADAMRSSAIAAALGPSLDALGEASRRDTSVRDAPAIFAGVHAIWEWAEHDAQVERFAVDEATAIGWSAYRENGWEPLRAIVAPLTPLVDRMAERCASDPRRHLAYAAKCAQFLVFRAECETLDAKRWPLVDRALAICPSHRNARVVACNFLCERAEVLLGGGVYFQASAVLGAEQALARAEELWPQGRRLGEVKRKLAEVKAIRSGFPGGRRVKDNLFDRWDLDPSSGPQAITERLRELAENADPGEQAELRRAWEELTVHPRRRILEALATHPETRPAVGRPPPPPRPLAAPRAGDAARIAHAPVSGALGGAAAPLALPAALPGLDVDPLLAVSTRPSRPPRPPGGST